MDLKTIPELGELPQWALDAASRYVERQYPDDAPVLLQQLGLIATESAHPGRAWRYARGLCKCAACYEALVTNRKNHKVNSHGFSGYGNGCRCDVCREGWRVYNKQRREARGR